MWRHLFSIHRLNRDVLRGKSPAKLKQLHDDLHAGKYPNAIITHRHKSKEQTPC